MKSSKYISILCVGSLLSLASCTDGFESDNKINGSFDDTVKEYDFQKYTTNFETIQKGIYFNYDWGEGTTWPWQTFQNLNHDMFSGYFHDFASKFSDKNTVYALEAGWTASAWNYTYNYIFPVAHKSTLITQDEAKYKHFYGATLILKVEAMHRITDTYGPIVYSKFGKNETNSVDTQEEAYKAFFDDLDKAVDALDTYLKEGSNVVYAVRNKREGETFMKKFTAKIYYRMLNSLSDYTFPVDTGDFRLIDRKVLDAFKQFPEKHKYLRGLFSWMGFKQTPFYYTRNERAAGRTKYSIRKMFSLASAGIFGFSKKPLKLAISLGTLSIFIALAFAIWIFIMYLSGKESIVPGWSSTIITIVFLGGVQLFTIGILGEYIGNIFDETKNRPEYIIDKKINFDPHNNQTI